MPPLKIGQTESKTFAVTKKDTAATVGSGDLNVLATPKLIAWMEHVAYEAAQQHLSANSSTVGFEIQCRHLAPTLPGNRIKIVAELSALEGKRIVFNIKAWDGIDTMVGEAHHTRFIIDSDRFMDKATENNQG